MNQVLSGFNREGVAVAKEVQVVCYADHGFVHMVGDDYSLAVFVLTDEFLHLFHIFRGHIREGLVQYAEFRL